MSKFQTKQDNFWYLTASLADSNELEAAGSYIDLTADKAGFGIIHFGDNVGHALFTFKKDGAVTLSAVVSANVFTSLQTGTDHVIIKDNGTNVRIVNELGAGISFTIEIMYNNS
jgi:hypothetical protein